MEGTDREESAEKSAKWSGKETEGLATEEEDDTKGGTGGIRKTRTATAQMSTGSGAVNISGSTAAGRGDTWVITSEAADEAGAGVVLGARPEERVRVAVRQENPSRESSGVWGKEGGPEVSRVA